jgi:hypothetical protein
MCQQQLLTQKQASSIQQQQSAAALQYKNINFYHFSSTNTSTKIIKAKKYTYQHVADPNAINISKQYIHIFLVYFINHNKIIKISC